MKSTRKLVVVREARRKAGNESEGCIDWLFALGEDPTTSHFDFASTRAERFIHFHHSDHLSCSRAEHSIPCAFGASARNARMLRKGGSASSMQKTYDECYLICSTAIYFEGQVGCLTVLKLSEIQSEGLIVCYTAEQ